MQNTVRRVNCGDLPHEIEIDLGKEHFANIHVKASTVGCLPILRQRVHSVLKGELEPLARRKFS